MFSYSDIASSRVQTPATARHASGATVDQERSTRSLRLSRAPSREGPDEYTNPPHDGPAEKDVGHCNRDSAIMAAQHCNIGGQEVENPDWKKYHKRDPAFEMRMGREDRSE